MSLINVSLEHRRTRDEARASLEKAVGDVQRMFAGIMDRADWSSDRNRVRMTGAGFWVEISVDDRHVTAIGDIPFLGGLLRGGLRNVLEQSFQKKLT